jgi:Icc-related predicted phosphoesterase
MKIWQISDLHLKKEELEGSLGLRPPSGADVAVVLGDLGGSLAENLRWCATHLRPFLPVVYVPGNHDFHWQGVAKASAEGRKLARSLGVHYLDGDTAVVAGARFTGGTFWSDFAVDMFGDRAAPEENVRRNMEAALGKADYNRIFVDDRALHRLRPWHTAAIHERTKGFVRRTLATPFDGPTVVLTHHGVLPEVTQPGYEASPTHPSYTSDQRELILKHRPALWLHGHVHHFHETRVGDTLVACNPRGFAGERPGFRPDYTHEL